MFYTYIIKSQNFNKYYIGYTNNLNNRLDEHNSGKSTYTKIYKPWKIIYYETFNTKTEALRREKYFKTASGRKWLKNNTKLINTCRDGEIARPYPCLGGGTGRHASLRS